MAETHQVVELLRCAADLCQRTRGQGWPGSEGEIGCVSIAAGALDLPIRIRDRALRAQNRVCGEWRTSDDRHTALLEAAARIEEGGVADARGERAIAMRMVKKAADWRVRAYPIQVRIYPVPADRGNWGLYSRHRQWGEAARRAHVEAANAHPTALVELVDSREGSHG